MVEYRTVNKKNPLSAPLLAIGVVVLVLVRTSDTRTYYCNQQKRVHIKDLNFGIKNVSSNQAQEGK